MKNVEKRTFFDKKKVLKIINDIFVHKSDVKIV